MKKIQAIALLVSVLINVLLLVLFLKTGRHKSYNPLPVADVINDIRNSVYNSLTIDSGDIVFVGTSLTEGFQLEEYYPGLPVKNRGIGGNESRHIAGRINSIINSRPSMIFLEMGVNDILGGASDKDLLTNYRKIVTDCRAAGIKIYINSIFPLDSTHAKENTRIPGLNDSLKVIAGDHYIDVYSKLVHDLYLPRSLTVDGIHINGRGYEIWKKQLDQYLNRLPISSIGFSK